MNAKQLAAAIRPQVVALLAVRTVAEAERARVDKIQRALLAERDYMPDARFIERGRDAGPIREPRDSYLICEADAKEYHDKLTATHLANGYADAAKGYCPALVAEHNRIKAEWALIEAAKPFLDVENNQLLCGRTKTSGERIGGLETRKEYIDLLCGLVVKAP